MTKKEMFAKAVEVIAMAEIETLTEETRNLLIEKLNHEIELLEKKSSKSGSTKKQKENEDLKVEILKEFETFDRAVTVTEFQHMTRFNMENGFSNQKLSAMFKQLVDANQLAKVTEKKKSYFSLVRE